MSNIIALLSATSDQ